MRSAFSLLYLMYFFFPRLDPEAEVPADSRLQAALDEAPHAPDGPSVSLMFPPVDEGDEAGRVQETLGSGARLQPWFLEAEAGCGPLARVGPQQQADKVLGGPADTLEIVPGKAEVQSADVLAGLLGTFVQEG